jgi:hypothetical protein
MSGPWRPLDYPGLHIDLGENTKPWSPQWGVWVREPYAELRCATGCEHHAHGTHAVAEFLEHLSDLQHSPSEGQQL